LPVATLQFDWLFAMNCVIGSEVGFFSFLFVVVDGLNKHTFESLCFVEKPEIKQRLGVVSLLSLLSLLQSSRFTMTCLRATKPALLDFGGPVCI